MVLGVGHRVEVERPLPGGARYGERAEIGTLALQRGDVLQHQRVADPVVRVHAEADRHDEALRYVVQRGQRREAGHVLLGGAEARLVAPHQDVGAAVDQHDRVDAVEVDQGAVGVAQRLHPGLGEGVHGGRVAVPLQPLGHGPLREIGLVGRGEGVTAARSGAARSSRGSPARWLKERFASCTSLPWWRRETATGRPE
ncbi:hypothetical protein ADK93_03725 [Streptomyces sp. XY58]|nr:hypothetical protein ADK93_03725 [Streptomyces sp. XY58]KOV11786.1 hypothetical protein ADK89_03110 [Streptomyces sp. XY37]KOV54977.1 hypothetical protein ADK99_04245 [Streptomyces sp. MMG1064]